MISDEDKHLIDNTLAGMPTRGFLRSRGSKWTIEHIKYARSRVTQKTKQASQKYVIKWLKELRNEERDRISKHKQKNTPQSAQSKTIAPSVQAAPPKADAKFSIAAYWKKFFQGLGVLLAIFGAFASYFTFTTKLSVYPSLSLDPNNPYKIAFTVENQGSLAVHSGKFVTRLIEIKYAGNKTITNSASFNDTDVFTKLAPGRQTTTWVRGDFVNFGKMEAADVSLVVSYRNALSFFRSEQSFRFRMVTNTMGEISWIPLGAEDS